MAPIWVVLEIRVPFRVLFISLPYYIGDLNRNPNLENYPYEFRGDHEPGLSVSHLVNNLCCRFRV